MFSTVDAFLGELEPLKDEFFPGAILETVYCRLEKISLRLMINDSLFIDSYLNAANGRFDFTLIKNNRRIFGFDNLISWHYHPATNPEDHIACDEPTLRRIAQETASVIASLPG